VAVGYGVAALLLRNRRGPVLCPFRLITGGPCPVCGLTRAVGHALSGDVRCSRGQHRLGPVVAAGLLVVAAAPPIN